MPSQWTFAAAYGSVRSYRPAVHVFRSADRKAPPERGLGDVSSCRDLEKLHTQGGPGAPKRFRVRMPVYGHLYGLAAAACYDGPFAACMTTSFRRATHSFPPRAAGSDTRPIRKRLRRSIGSAQTGITRCSRVSTGYVRSAFAIPFRLGHFASITITTIRTRSSAGSYATRATEVWACSTTIRIYSLMRASTCSSEAAALHVGSKTRLTRRVVLTQLSRRVGSNSITPAVRFRTRRR